MREGPSWCVKLCTYLRWVASPDKISTEPYHEVPLPGDEAQMICAILRGCLTWQLQAAHYLGRLEQMLHERIKAFNADCRLPEEEVLACQAGRATPQFS